VFGAGGQVGREVFRAAWPRQCTVLPLDRGMVDITKSAAVDAMLARESPDLVMNLAAYNAVEPLGVYGRSKEAGERAVRAALAHHVILRTAWVFGAYGANFVKTMLRLAAERPVLRVVADQRGCPTAAADIAAALIVIAAQIERGEARWGTYHFAGAGPVSWNGFAEAIFDLAAPWLAARPRVEPINTDQYPTPVRRPLNSVLDCHKITEVGISPPPWRPALAAVIRELLDGKPR